MKPLCITLCLGGLCATAGDFVNLTFDEPDLSGDLVPIYPGGALRGLTSEILRGWTVTAGGSPVLFATYATYRQPWGSEVVSVFQNEPTSPLGDSVYLRSGPAGPQAPEIRLSQTGTIPQFATGLEVDSAGYVQGFINGTKSGEVNNLLAGPFIWDVRPYQGQTVKLEIYVRPNDQILFDILGFRPIPEPSTWALLGMGTALLGWQTWRRRGQR